MDVAPAEIILVVILSFEAALHCELTNIIIVTKKSQQTSIRNKNCDSIINRDHSNEISLAK